MQEIEGAGYPKDISNPSDHPVVLAFDLSGSCIGWAVGIGGALINYGKYVFKTTAMPGEKLLAFAELLETLFTTYQPEILLAEKPLARGKTVNHFEFLGVLRLAWRDYTGEELDKEHIISPRTVKTHLNVPRGRNHQHNKELMVKKINTLFRLNLVCATSKYKSDDDTADAIAVMVTYWMLHAVIPPTT